MDKKKQFIKDFKTAYTEGDVSSNAAKISYFLIFAIDQFHYFLYSIYKQHKSANNLYEKI